MTTQTLQSEQFKILDSNGDKNRLHVEIKGLGIVTINRTDEGLIIDAHDLTDCNESLASMALENDDFYDTYVQGVELMITSFDQNIDVSPEFIAQAKGDNLTVHQAAESWFADCSFDTSTLVGLKGECAEFHTEVRKFNRPYLKISEQTQDELMKAPHDYYKTNTGKVVTFGGADGGYALMPLNDEAAA